ncbi:MAG: hypothetical protein ACRDUV_05180, partial [Pseudonocardiaceae bacterium]
RVARLVVAAEDRGAQFVGDLPVRRCRHVLTSVRYALRYEAPYVNDRARPGATATSVLQYGARY